MARVDPIPVHLIRRGPLARNSGGPIRVITDLLDTSAETGRYESYGYVSVNDSRMFEHGESVAATARADSPAKHAAAKTLNASNLGLYLQLRRDAWRLRNRLKASTTPERVIHSHDQIASGLALTGRTPLNILTVHSKGSVLNDVKLKVHPRIAGTWMQDEFEKLERQGIAAASVVTFPSGGARQLFDRDVPGALDGKDVRIVHNGVDMKSFSFPAPERRDGDMFTIVNVSALVEEKRFDRTIEIVAALKERGRAFRIIHVGSGHLEERMRAEVLKRKLEDIVVFNGRMRHPDVVSVLRNAHAFLLPAERTVFDIATLEAMAAGLPAVVSDEGGNREMMTDRKNGFLCDPDDTGTFTDCLASLMDDESLRRSTGMAARETVKSRFTIKRVADAYEAIYHDCLKHST